MAAGDTSDNVRELLTSQYTGAAVQLAISSSTATSAQLTSVGRWVLCPTVDCYIKQGTSAITAVLATSHYVAAGSRVEFTVSDITANGYVAAITSSASGTLCLSKL